MMEYWAIRVIHFNSNNVELGQDPIYNACQTAVTQLTLAGTATPLKLLFGEMANENYQKILAHEKKEAQGEQTETGEPHG